MFHYAYAVFYSPMYRTRYAQFLKSDFPRLPLTTNLNLFRRLCALGRRLVALHLMYEDAKERSRYPVPGSNEVRKVSFATDADRLGDQNPPGSPDMGRVYINAEQYFEGVPARVWTYHIGGYQMCHKWLKDRKSRLLSYDDIKTYHRIVAALAETIELQEKIDDAIPGWPLG